MEATPDFPYASTDCYSLGMDLEVGDGSPPIDVSPDTMFTDPFQPNLLSTDFTTRSDPMAFPSMVSLKGATEYQDMKSPKFISPSTTESGSSSAPITVDLAELKRQDQQQPLPKKRGRPRRSMAKSSTDATASPPKRARPPIASSSRKGSTNDPDEGSDHSSDRSHLRARNRVAAAKFRERKRQSVGKLMEQEECARAANRMLAHEIAQLRDETLQLKSMVLEHAGCGCGYIDKYIKDAASGLVINASPLSSPGSTSASGSTLGSIPGSESGYGSGLASAGGSGTATSSNGGGHMYRD